MKNEEEVRSVVKKVLDEERLLGFVEIFEKEHNLFRGSHDKIGLPETLDIPQEIIEQVTEDKVSPGDVYSHIGGEDNPLVNTEAIADAAIETAKIANAAVEAGKIAALAVTEAKLAALAVTTAKIAASAVETAKIANLAIEEGKLAASAVTEGKIAALAVSAGKVAAGAIVAEKIDAGAVTTVKLDALAVTADKIGASAITTAKLDALAITAAKIAVGAIEAAKIAAGAVEAVKIAAGAVTTVKLDALAVTAAKIAALTITAGKIAANAIETDKIKALNVTAAKIAANTITAAQIAAGTITAAEIFAGTITAVELILDQRVFWYSTPSTTTRHSNDDVRLTASGSYVKVKEVKMNESTGEMKLYFEMKTSVSAAAYGRIYKNGSPIGTERSTGSTTYVPYTEDLGGFEENDLIQIYAYNTATGTSIRNFRFQYDRAVAIIAGAELDTPLPTVEQTIYSMTNQDP